MFRQKKHVIGLAWASAAFLAIGTTAALAQCELKWSESTHRRWVQQLGSTTVVGRGTAGCSDCCSSASCSGCDHCTLSSCPAIPGTTTRPPDACCWNGPSTRQTETCERFGGAVALAGDYAFVGAILDASITKPHVGAGYAFERLPTGSWILPNPFNKLNEPSVDFPFFVEEFGSSVSVGGVRAVVGAFRENNDFSANCNTGAAFVFARTNLCAGGMFPGRSCTSNSDCPNLSPPGGYVPCAPFWLPDAPTGTMSYKLTADILHLEDAFGASVSISGDGNRIVVGAPGVDGTAADTGAAYVFERNMAGIWERKAKLTASDAAANDHFGFSVSINGAGNLIVVGATGVDSLVGSDTGAAYVFRPKSGGGWEPDESTMGAGGHKLTAGTDAHVNDLFGTSVSINRDANHPDGNRIVVGAPYADAMAPDSGAAYVFSPKPGGGWEKDPTGFKLISAAPATGDLFGTSVSITSSSNPNVGHRIVVGARACDKVVCEADQGTGGWGCNTCPPGFAYLFQRDWRRVWERKNKLSGSAVPGNKFGSSVSIDGDRVLVGASCDHYLNKHTGAAYVFDITDCDTDGLLDACQLAPGCTGFCLSDCHRNGIPDVCDYNSGFDGNCNGNAWPDKCEVMSTGLCPSSGAPVCYPDCNGNFQPDYCDSAPGSTTRLCLTNAF